MTMTLEISPEVEANARAEANRQGRTITELLAEVMETRFSVLPSLIPQGERTLAETLAGRTGKARSGGSSHGRNSESEFGKLMASKRQNGHS